MGRSFQFADSAVLMGKRKREQAGGSSDSEAEEKGGAPTSKKTKLAEDPPEKAEATVSTLEDEITAQRERMELLVSAFSNSQQDQYEIFRRATFPKSTIKKIMQGVCGGTVPPNAVIAMSGITKVFVGEIVEEACQARDSAQEEGPLQPKHIREAVRRLKNNDKLPSTRYKKVFPMR